AGLRPGRLATMPPQNKMAAVAASGTMAPFDRTGSSLLIVGRGIGEFALIPATHFQDTEAAILSFHIPVIRHHAMGPADVVIGCIVVGVGGANGVFGMG